MRHYKLKTKATESNYEHICKYDEVITPSNSDWVEKGRTESERSEHSSIVTRDENGEYSFDPRLPTENDEKLVKIIFEGHRDLLDASTLVMRIKSEFVVS